MVQEHWICAQCFEKKYGELFEITEMTASIRECEICHRVDLSVEDYRRHSGDDEERSKCSCFDPVEYERKQANWEAYQKRQWRSLMNRRAYEERLHEQAEAADWFDHFWF